MFRKFKLPPKPKPRPLLPLPPPPPPLRLRRPPPFLEPELCLPPPRELPAAGSVIAVKAAFIARKLAYMDEYSDEGMLSSKLNCCCSCGCSCGCGCCCCRCRRGVSQQGMKWTSTMASTVRTSQPAPGLLGSINASQRCTKNLSSTSAHRVSLISATS